MAGLLGCGRLVWLFEDDGRLLIGSERDEI